MQPAGYDISLAGGWVVVVCTKSYVVAFSYHIISDIRFLHTKILKKAHAWIAAIHSPSFFQDSPAVRILIAFFWSWLGFACCGLLDSIGLLSDFDHKKKTWRREVWKGKLLLWDGKSPSVLPPGSLPIEWQPWFILSIWRSWTLWPRISPPI